MIRVRFTLLAPVLAMAATVALAGEGPRPPMAKKKAHTFQLHGDTLVDDYHWLRNKGTAEVEEHLNAELACAQAFMQYRYMRSYSPYDNIEAKAYPTTLVKTSYNDSQVMYWEPAKYVAKLRAMKTDRNPLVFRINMDPAGHGGKSGRYERLRETAFDYAFLLWQLGVEKVGP